MVYCEICSDLGCIRDAHEQVHPCPVCSFDSGYESGEWQATETEREERCRAKDGRRARNGGYSASCIKPKGHDGEHEDDYGRWWV